MADCLSKATVFSKFPLDERVEVDARYLNKWVYKSIENKLRNSVEGVCSKHGFVRPGSISVKSVGLGTVATESGGVTTFPVQFDADVCNPLVGCTIVCRIEAMSAFAAFAINAADDVRVLEVIVPQSPRAFQHEVPFSDLRVGAIVALKILGKRFHLGQKTIVCAGQLTPLAPGIPQLCTESPVVERTPRVSGVKGVVLEDALDREGWRPGGLAGTTVSPGPAVSMVPWRVPW